MTVRICKESIQKCGSDGNAQGIHPAVQIASDIDQGGRLVYSNFLLIDNNAEAVTDISEVQEIADAILPAIIQGKGNTVSTDS